jgi:hypothetical protein
MISRHMKPRRWATAALIVLLALPTAVVSSAKAAAKSTNPAVTSTLFDSDPNLNSLLVQSDDGTETGSATYVTGSTTGVISEIDGYQLDEWDLWLQNSSRGFYLTLETTTGSPVAGLPAGRYFYSGRLVSRCFDPTGVTTNTYPWFSVQGADLNCAMRVNFTYGGTQYTLVMGPGYSGTGKALVTCNSANTRGSCVDWTIFPNLTAANPTVAYLYSIGKGGKEVFVAACQLRYRMHVTYP